MFYTIKYNGTTVKGVYYQKYKSELHAVNAAYKALQKQPYPPENGCELSTAADIFRHTYSLNNKEYVATINDQGEISFDE